MEISNRIGEEEGVSWILAALEGVRKERCCCGAAIGHSLNYFRIFKLEWRIEVRKRSRIVCVVLWHDLRVLNV